MVSVSHPYIPSALSDESPGQERTEPAVLLHSAGSPCLVRFLYFPYDNLYLFYASPPAFLSLLYFRTTPLTASTRSTTLALVTNATGSLSTTAIQSSPLYRYNCMVVSG